MNTAYFSRGSPYENYQYSRGLPAYDGFVSKPPVAFSIRGRGGQPGWRYSYGIPWDSRGSGYYDGPTPPYELSDNSIRYQTWDF